MLVVFSQVRNNKHCCADVLSLILYSMVVACKYLKMQDII